MFTNRTRQPRAAELKVRWLAVFVIVALLAAATSQADVSGEFAEGNAIYLPLVLNNLPDIPETPVLNAIENSDGDGNYTISWSSSAGAGGYLLQEANTPDFSSPISAYSGPNTSTAINGREVGTYYYRVQAVHFYVSSGWSNTQSAVVTVPPPNCPRAGVWYGTTSEGYLFHFNVENSPACQITPGSLMVHAYLNCGTGFTLYTITFASGTPIVDNHFEAGNTTDWVTGDFSTLTSAGGPYHVTPRTGCTETGTWQAAPNGASSTVSALAVQADDRVLVGGKFNFLGGLYRFRIGRINSDGTLDTDFTPTLGGSTLYGLSVIALAVQADGKILVGGAFTELNAQPRNYIGRLNPDGTLDPDFNPGASTLVDVLLEQDDHKILVGGRFSTLGGQPRSKIGRLNPDGTLDAAFNPGSGGNIYALALQDDQKILVGGQFTQLGGQPRNFIGRLNPDGTLDPDFNPGADQLVNTLAVQADGKILVGGGFEELGGQTRNYIGRLNPDGSLDTGFNPGANGSVEQIVVQPDGKILVAGYFTELGGAPRYRIARLNSDGTLDASFNPGVDGVWAYTSVRALVVQSDGKMMIGGDFTEVGGELRNFIGWLNPDGTLGPPVP